MRITLRWTLAPILALLAAATATADGKPDLAITAADLAWPAEVVAGQEVEITATYRYQGDAALEADEELTYGIAIVTAGDLSKPIGDPVAGPLGPLAPGAEGRAAGKLTAPRAAGEYVVVVTLDAGAKLDEGDEENNEARKTLTVGPPAGPKPAAGKPASTGTLRLTRSEVVFPLRRLVWPVPFGGVTWFLKRQEVTLYLEGGGEDEVQVQVLGGELAFDNHSLAAGGSGRIRVSVSKKGDSLFSRLPESFALKRNEPVTLKIRPRWFFLPVSTRAASSFASRTASKVTGRSRI